MVAKPMPPIVNKMTDKTTENNKLDIQNRQDAVDAEIVHKYLINNSNSKKINLAYYIDQKASLKKKLKACNRETKATEDQSMIIPSIAIKLYQTYL